MNLADHRWLRLATLCLLYVAQGLPWGFTASTIPSYLAQRGLDAAAIGGALAMTTVPYSFKWIWGPLIDAFPIPRLGRRRPWIVFAQLMMAATILAMIAIPDLTGDLRALAWMIFLHTIFNSMQDVAVDALAVDLLEDDERGRANGMMYACKYLGGFLGGAGIATVVEYAGFNAALYVQVILLLAIMVLPLLVRETAAPTAWVRTKSSETLGEVGRGLVEAFSVRSSILAILVILAFPFAYGVIYANGFTLYTQHLGWSAADYARLTGGFGLLVGFASAVAGGFLSDLLGKRAVAAGVSVLVAATWIGFALLRDHWDVTALVFLFTMLQAAGIAVMSVALIALCMDLSSARVGASHFAAYMAMHSVSTTIGFQLAGWASSTWEFDGMYLVAAALQLVITPLVFTVDPGETRRVLPRPAGTPTSIRGLVALSVLFAGLVVMTAWTLSSTLG